MLHFSIFIHQHFDKIFVQLIYLNCKTERGRFRHILSDNGTFSYFFMLKSLSDNILNQLTGRVFIIMGDKAPMNFEKSLFGDYEKY